MTLIKINSPVRLVTDDLLKLRDAFFVKEIDFKDQRQCKLPMNFYQTSPTIDHGAPFEREALTFSCASFQ